MFIKIRKFGVHWVCIGLSLTISMILGKLPYHLRLNFIIYINNNIIYLVIMAIKLIYRKHLEQ